MGASCDRSLTQIIGRSRGLMRLPMYALAPALSDAEMLVMSSFSDRTTTFVSG